MVELRQLNYIYIKDIEEYKHNYLGIINGASTLQNMPTSVWIKEEIKNSRKITNLIYKDDCLVGFICYRFSPSKIAGNIGISILPTERSKGIGSIALNMFILYLYKKFNLSTFRVTVDINNKVSYTFFLKNKFKLLEIFKNNYILEYKKE